MPKACRRPGRPARNNKPGGINRERLVTEAVTIFKAEGLTGLSTRRLAERLGVKSPALYWHVRNMDELLQLVADAICAQMALPPTGQPFRKRLEKIASEYRRVLISYSDAPRLFAEQPPTGPHRMRLYEAAVATFVDAGFPIAEAIAMSTFYRHYLLGMITEEVRAQQTGKEATFFPAFALGVELQQTTGSASDCPNLSRGAKLLTDIQPELLFTAGLNVILDGLEKRAHASRHAKAAHGVPSGRRRNREASQRNR